MFRKRFIWLLCLLCAGFAANAREATSPPSDRILRCIQHLGGSSDEIPALQTDANPSSQTFDLLSLPAPVAVPSGDSGVSRLRRASIGTDYPDIYGYVTVSSGYPRTGRLYRLPIGDDDRFLPFGTSFNFSTGGGLVGDEYCYEYRYKPAPWMQGYVSSWCKRNIYSNTQTYSTILNGAVNGEMALGGIALNPKDGKIYGIFGYQGTLKTRLCTIDLKPEGFEITEIAVYGDNPDQMDNKHAFAISPEGKAYFFDGGDLYTVNLQTGEFTKIGNTGFVPYHYPYQHSCAIFDQPGRLFWAAKDSKEDSYLMEVNPNTAETTVISKFPSKTQLKGLFILPKVAKKAPAQPTNLKAEFEPGNFTGSFSFTAPTILQDSTAAQGTLNYKVLVDSLVLSEGTTTYGEKVTVNPVTMKRSGNILFTVICSNDAGEGIKAQKYALVGYGEPKAPWEVRARYNASGTVALSWDTVKKATDSRYFLPEEVTYTVTRLKNGVPETVVTEKTKATTATDNLSDPGNVTSYSYSVTAHFRTENSMATESNWVALGMMKLPYNGINSDEDIRQWNIYNMDGDAKGWERVTTNANYMIRSFCYNDTVDDWLISPRLHLEAEKAYRIWFYGRGMNLKDNGAVEIRCGDNITPESLTTVLMPRTRYLNQHILHSPTDPVFEILTAEEQTRDICVGIRALGDNSFYLGGLKIEEVGSAKLAQKVGDLKVLASQDELKAQVSFTAPDKDLAGRPLSSISKIEVRRTHEYNAQLKDALAKTFENPIPGAALSFTDILPQTGRYQYYVVAYNTQGKGLQTDTIVRVGYGVPQTIDSKDFKVAETATLGTVRVSWTPVTRTTDGDTLPAHAVRYTLADTNGGDFIVLKDNMQDTVVEVKLQEPNAAQRVVQLSVRAYTNGGKASWQQSEPFLTGPAYRNYVLDFAEGKCDKVLWVVGNQQDGIVWDTDMLHPSVTRDGGYYGILSTSKFSNKMYSGKISLEGLENPELTFYVYNQGDNENEIEVAARLIGEDWETLLCGLMTNQGVKINSLGGQGWQKVTVPLRKFAGNVIQYKINSTYKNTGATYFDDFKVADAVQNDLAALYLTLPGDAAVGQKFKAVARVSNDGKQAAENFTIRLLRGDDVAAMKTVDKLDAGKVGAYELEVEMLPLGDTPQYFRSVVEWNSDGNKTNNESKPVAVAPLYNSLPGVNGLQGEYTDPDNKLRWEAPASDDGTRVFGFEDGTSWEKEYEGWTFLDADGYPVGGLSNYDLPGITAGKTAMSYAIYENFGYQWLTPHSGHRGLMSLCRYDQGPTDDWAISPELDGSAQEISLWARNLFENADSHGSFSLYYSTAGTEKNDFKLIEEAENLTPSYGWMRFSVNVPKGAKYFAIRTHATGGWFLFFDDIEMRVKSPADAFIPLGYNLYRDGNLLATLNSQVSTYTDSGVEKDRVYTYAVAPRFAKGNGQVKYVSVKTNGVEERVCDGVNVYAEGRNILIGGAEGKNVSVISADGRIIYSDAGKEHMSVPVDAGVYVVRVGRGAVKLIVK